MWRRQPSSFFLNTLKPPPARIRNMPGTNSPPVLSPSAAPMGRKLRQRRQRPSPPRFLMPAPAFAPIPHFCDGGPFSDHLQKKLRLKKILCGVSLAAMTLSPPTSSGSPNPSLALHRKLYIEISKRVHSARQSRMVDLGKYRSSCRMSLRNCVPTAHAAAPSRRFAWPVLPKDRLEPCTSINRLGPTGLERPPHRVRHMGRLPPAADCRSRQRTRDVFIWHFSPVPTLARIVCVLS